MNTLKCQVPNHYEKIINTVCLDKYCQENRFGCLKCLIQQHNTHQSKCVEISEITQFIEQEMTRQVSYPDTCSYGQNQIIQGLEEINKLIENLQKIIREEIQIIKAQNLQDFLRQTRNNYQEMEYWKHIFEGILQYIDIQDNHISLKVQTKTLNNLEQIQMNVVQTSQQSLQKIMKQINLSKMSEIQSQLYFLEDRKNKYIAIIDQSIITKIQKESCAMAFANEGFDPANQNYSFAFNIQNIVQQVWIGVGNDEGGNLSPSYLISEDKQQAVGHGQYMISSFNNLILHHTNKQLNYKAKGMDYGAGDTIQIKYDCVTRNLEFRKSLDQNAVVKMHIKDLTKKLYPCALLSYVGDLVELVEY